MKGLIDHEGLNCSLIHKSLVLVSGAIWSHISNLFKSDILGYPKWSDLEYILGKQCFVEAQLNSG